MATRENTAPQALSEIMVRFMTALCILECAVRSLEEWHDPSTAVDEETTCLRHGLHLMGSVYDELDRAAMREKL